MIRHGKARRDFLPYLCGTLAPGRVRKLEAHLAACEACRETISRMAEGHRMAQKLASLEKNNPLIIDEFGTPPPFSAALADAGGGSGLRRKWEGWRMSWSLAAAAPKTTWILAIMVVAQAVLLVFLNRGSIFGPPSARAISGIALERFQVLDIAEVPLNAHPHIATEGYVRKVWMDAEENTLHFMLASSPEGESPYVICEILSPDRISAPLAGSHVRVYGLARYDAQIGRQWHEVNPVLDISVLKR